ncbi:Conserved_hypothetical protein [Hexamita inflata]|uniref:Transcriptional adapter 2-alpha/beta-like domain-containing protein n=1 Tax=Hexamita inflata TaxID=28002 RepID=A0ABP1HCF4_9EUKA
MNPSFEECNFCMCPFEADQLKMQCAYCKDFNICLDCYLCKIEYKGHRNTHRMFPIVHYNTPIWDDGFTLIDDLLLLEAILVSGFGSWDQIKTYMKRPATEPVENLVKHYFVVYGPAGCLSTSTNPQFRIDPTPLLSPSKPPSNFMQKLQNQPLNMISAPLSHEFPPSRTFEEIPSITGEGNGQEFALGSWPKRFENSFEFINKAEYPVMMMHLIDDETKDSMNMKIQVLQGYAHRLVQRARMKFTVFQNSLHRVDKKIDKSVLEADKIKLKLIHKGQLSDFVSPEEYMNDTAVDKFEQEHSYLFRAFHTRLEFRRYCKNLLAENELRTQIFRLQTARALGIKTCAGLGQEIEFLKNPNEFKQKVMLPPGVAGDNGFDLNQFKNKLGQTINQMNPALANAPIKEQIKYLFTNSNFRIAGELGLPPSARSVEAVINLINSVEQQCACSYINQLITKQQQILRQPLVPCQCMMTRHNATCVFASLKVKITDLELISKLEKFLNQARIPTQQFDEQYKESLDNGIIPVDDKNKMLFTNRMLDMVLFLIQQLDSNSLCILQRTASQSFSIVLTLCASLVCQICSFAIFDKLYDISVNDTDQQLNKQAITTNTVVAALLSTFQGVNHNQRQTLKLLQNIQTWIGQIMQQCGAFDGVISFEQQQLSLQTQLSKGIGGTNYKNLIQSMKLVEGDLKQRVFIQKSGFRSNTIQMYLKIVNAQSTELSIKPINAFSALAAVIKNINISNFYQILSQTLPDIISSTKKIQIQSQLITQLQAKRFQFKNTMQTQPKYIQASAIFKQSSKISCSQQLVPNSEFTFIGSKLLKNNFKLFSIVDEAMFLIDPEYKEPETTKVQVEPQNTISIMTKAQYIDFKKNQFQNLKQMGTVILGQDKMNKMLQYLNVLFRQLKPHFQFNQKHISEEGQQVIAMMIDQTLQKEQLTKIAVEISKQNSDNSILKFIKKPPKIKQKKNVMNFATHLTNADLIFCALFGISPVQIFNLKAQFCANNYIISTNLMSQFNNRFLLAEAYFASLLNHQSLPDHIEPTQDFDWFNATADAVFKLSPNEGVPDAQQRRLRTSVIFTFQDKPIQFIQKLKVTPSSNTNKIITRNEVSLEVFQMLQTDNINQVNHLYEQLKGIFMFSKVIQNKYPKRNEPEMEPEIEPEPVKEKEPEKTKYQNNGQNNQNNGQRDEEDITNIEPIAHVSQLDNSITTSSFLYRHSSESMSKPVIKAEIKNEPKPTQFRQPQVHAPINIPHLTIPKHNMPPPPIQMIPTQIPIPVQIQPPQIPVQIPVQIPKQVPVQYQVPPQVNIRPNMQIQVPVQQLPFVPPNIQPVIHQMPFTPPSLPSQNQPYAMNAHQLVQQQQQQQLVQNQPKIQHVQPQIQTQPINQNQHMKPQNGIPAPPPIYQNPNQILVPNQPYSQIPSQYMKPQIPSQPIPQQPVYLNTQQQLPQNKPQVLQNIPNQPLQHIPVQNQPLKPTQNQQVNQLANQRQVLPFQPPQPVRVLDFFQPPKPAVEEDLNEHRKQILKKLKRIVNENDPEFTSFRNVCPVIGEQIIKLQAQQQQFNE